MNHWIGLSLGFPKPLNGLAICHWSIILEFVPLGVWQTLGNHHQIIMPSVDRLLMA